MDGANRGTAVADPAASSHTAPFLASGYRETMMGCGQRCRCYLHVCIIESIPQAQDLGIA